MNTTTGFGIKTIRIIDGFINSAMLVVVLLLFAFGAFSLWDTNQIHHIARSSNYQRYRPMAEADGGVSFTSLQAMNPDVFAWLHVYGTNIDYPVVQGRDNFQYVNTNVHGQHSLAGAIFLDYRNANDFSNFSSIIHGHHMANRVMFGEISEFANRDYFDARRHGTLFFDGREHGIDFFAFVSVDAHDRMVYRPDMSTEAAKQAHLDHLLALAVHVHEDMTVSTDSRLVLLSTCSPGVTHMRDVLVGVITDTVQPDPFYVPVEHVIPIIPALARIDTASGFMSRVGDFMPDVTTMVAAFLAVAALVGLGVGLAKARKKKAIAVVLVGLVLGLVLSHTVVTGQSLATVTLVVQQTAPPGTSFTYRLVPESSEFEPMYLSIIGTHHGNFAPLSFHRAGIFVFTLENITPDTPPLTIDRSVYRIIIQVTNDGDAFVSVYNGDIKTNHITYVHTQPPSGGIPDPDPDPSEPDPTPQPTTQPRPTPPPPLPTTPPDVEPPIHATQPTFFDYNDPRLRPPLLDLTLGDLPGDLVDTLTPEPVVTPGPGGGFSPQTGDTSRPLLWVMLIMGSVLAITLLLVAYSKYGRRGGV